MAGKRVITIQVITIPEMQLYHRYLFFFSDPPHLIKTMRNCWTSKCRTLWVNENCPVSNPVPRSVSYISVADLEILKGGFVGTYTAHRRRRCAEPRSGDQSARSAENFIYVFFLAIRKRSRSISAHSGHVPRRKED